MGETFANLRAAIYSNEEELQRFRKLLVNSVMATDIVRNSKVLYKAHRLKPNLTLIVLPLTDGQGSRRRTKGSLEQSLLGRNNRQ